MGGNFGFGGNGNGRDLSSQLSQMPFASQIPGGAGMPFIDPSQLDALRSQMQRSMSPEMQQRLRDAMMQGGPGGGGMQMMAFGIGTDERGKRVAKAASMTVDASGKVQRDFREQQLDPDDPLLPKETVESYDVSDATEVHFEEDTPKIHGESNGEPISETEIEIETAEEPPKK